MNNIHIVTFKEKDHDKNKKHLEKHVEKHAKKVKKPKLKRELKNLPRVFILEDADDELLGQLRNDPNVVDIEEDFVVDRPHMAQTSEWSHALMDIAAFHSRGFTGVGVKVGYIDTGAAPHEDLVYAGKKNCYSTSVPADADYDGHGTKVAGIIGGRNNALGYVGVAPDCSLYAVKSDDNAGSGMFISAQIDGVDWLVSEKVKIISCSFGAATDSSSRKAAFEDAYSLNDVLFICAAGNEGDNHPIENTSPHYPSDYDFVISVACLKGNKEPASYSSRNSKIDIAAPGDNVKTTVRSDVNQAGTDYTTPSTSYGYFNGTSCAAPHIAGLAALYKQMYPSYTADQLRNLILSNKEDLGKDGTDIVFGAGMAISPWTTPTTYTGKLTSTAITLTGTSASGSMTEGKAIHFKYVAPSSGSYTFKTSASIDLFMRLYDANYNLIDWNDDDAGSSQPLITAALTAGQTYYINVSGYSNLQTGTFTLQVTAPGTAPTAPTLSVGSATQNSLMLTYSSTGAAAYDIYRGSTKIVSDTTATSYVDSGLTAGATYTYYVVAKNAYGSATSATKTGTTLSSSPGSTPSNPIVVSGTSASGTISSGGDLYFRYTTPTSGSYTFTLATGYDSYLEVYSDSGYSNRIAYDDDGNGSGQPRVVVTLSGNTTYYLKAFGYSHNTSYFGACTLNITAPSAGSAPSQPTIAWASRGGTYINLSFSATGATSYDLYKDGSFYANFTSTTCSVTGLVRKTPYTFYVIAKNLYGSSTPSSTITVSTT